MELLVSNFNGGARRATLNGREFFVAPLTMIVPGVLTGSKGSLFYPAEEVAKEPEAWNYMPLLVNHPIVNGEHVSGRSPDIVEKFGIGYVFNAHISDNKLRAEGWFDVQKTKSVEPRIWQWLEAGKPIRLSTGLFTKNFQAPPGMTYNGRPYTHIARNYRPDHLAILPDMNGACDITDGCGVNVYNSAACCDSCREGKPCEATANSDNCGTGKGGFQKGNSCAGASTKGKQKAVSSAPRDDLDEEFTFSAYPEFSKSPPKSPEERRKALRRLKQAAKEAEADPKDGSKWETFAITALATISGLSAGTLAWQLINKFLVGNCGGTGGKPGPCPTTTASPTKGGDKPQGTKPSSIVEELVPGIRMYKNATHPDAIAENKKLIKAVFKAATLGTGPTILKGIKAIFKHAPDVAKTIWSGVKKLHKAVKDSHSKENAMAAPALTRNAALTSALTELLVSKYLTAHPEKIPTTNFALRKALHIMGQHVFNGFGICVNCGGKGGKPGPCKGQKKGTKQIATSSGEAPERVRNPSSSEKGWTGGAVKNPHHSTFTKLGYKYSHTTPIHRADGSVYLHDSYSHPDYPDERLGTDEQGNWSTHKGGSGRSYGGKALDPHKFLTSRLKKLSKTDPIIKAEKIKVGGRALK